MGAFVLASHIFYDLIRKNRGDKVSFKFVEDFLKNFVPETAEGKLTSEGTAMMPRVIKKDVYVEFQNEIIKNYILFLKLNEETEESWMNHWKSLNDEKKS